MNRNRLDREVVEAATLHRDCGLGVLVDWQRERNEESDPAQSLGFARDFRVCVSPRFLRPKFLR